MRALMAVLLSIPVLFLATGEKAGAAGDQRASAYVLCKSQKNVRTIKILPNPRSMPDAGAKMALGCAVSYSKNGVDEIVGTNRSMESCKSILKSIQYNLETSKWSCRNVQSAFMTTSKEAITQ